MIMFFDKEFISEIKGKYNVHRTIKGKDIDFGTFDTLEEAIAHRNKLEDDGWPVPIVRSTNSEDSIEHIKKSSDNQYIVFKVINNKEKTFGPYNSLNEAKIAKRNLLSNGWESDLEFSRAKYGKYIRKDGNNFKITKQINGEFHYFGSYSSLEEAIKNRDELVDNNWGEFHILKDNSLKYIVYNGKNFQVQKSIKGKLITFGRYEELNDAIIARNKFVSETWTNIPTNNKVKRNTNIYTTNKGFEVCKRIDGEFKIFKTFDKLEDAIKFRDALKKNNWDIKKVISKKKVNKPSFSEDLINFDGEYYVIERLTHEGIRVYGVFKNKNLAIKFRDKILNEGWPKYYSIKSKKYPYGENIIPFDYIFNIEKEFNGELLEFGPFYSFEEAVKNYLNLVENNWNINENNANDEKLSFDDIKSIYDNIVLVDEPEISFPQEDGFKNILKLAEVLYEKKYLDKQEIMELLNVKSRQYNFIISAGQYLGIFVDKISESQILSSEGMNIFSLNTKDRNLKLIKLILQHKPYYDIFTKYLEIKRIPDSDTIFEILKNNYIYNIESDTTLKRRSSSARSWIVWIVDLIKK